jgi:cobalt/nickel transport system permease protein
MAAQFKLAGLLLFLAVLSATPLRWLPVWIAVALATATASKVGVRRLLGRAAIVLPLSGLVALTTWLAGDAAQAGALLVRSYVSVFAAALFNATTTVPDWTAALAAWRVPAALILTLQFVHRYLFVVLDEAGRTRLAARSRGGFRFDAAIGAIGALFARSWRRSEAVHRAMIARGFTGRIS